MYLGGKTGLWSGPESSMGWLGSNCDSEAKRDPESRGIVEVFVAGDFAPVLECDMAGLLLGFDEAMLGLRWSGRGGVCWNGRVEVILLVSFCSGAKVIKMIMATHGQKYCTEQMYLRLASAQNGSTYLQLFTGIP